MVAGTIFDPVVLDDDDDDEPEVGQAEDRQIDRPTDRQKLVTKGGSDAQAGPFSSTRLTCTSHVCMCPACLLLWAQVSIVGTRRPAVPAQQPPRAPALRGAAVSFHDFPPFLLGGPLLDPAALMMGDTDQHWVDFFSQGPAPRARALGRP